MSKSGDTPVLLSGGNPQIPKGYGEAPVAAYIAAMPGWKQRIGQTVDALVTDVVPNVEKAVKWNSPFYGMKKDVWFLSLHCFDRFVRLTFFDGAELPEPPLGRSKYPRVRYHDIHEQDPVDTPQLRAWVLAASRLPGEKL